MTSPPQHSTTRGMLGVRLLVVGVALFIVALLPMLLNITLLGRVEERRQWQEEAGPIRRDVYRLLYLVERLEVAPPEAQQRLLVDARSIHEDIQRRVQRLADAPSQPEAAGSLEVIQRIWLQEITEPLQEITQTADPAARERARQRLRQGGVALNAEISRAERAQAQHLERQITLFRITQGGLAATALALFILVAVLVRSIMRREEQSALARRMGALVNIANDGIISIDARGVILTFNRAAEDLFGYTPEEVIGKNVSCLMPSPHQEAHDTYLANYLRTGVGKILGKERRLEARHRDGTCFPILLRITEWREGNAHTFVGLIHDMRLPEQRLRLMGAIQGVTTTLVQSTAHLLAAAAEQSRSAQLQAASVTDTAQALSEVSEQAAAAAAAALRLTSAARRAAAIGEEGRGAVENTTAAMERVRTRAEVIAASIQELTEQLGAIHIALDAVNDFADQTHLLSINAAIEASRAGEYGLGFAVVAREVRALADRSRAATREIRDLLNLIQLATSQVVHATREGSQSVEGAFAASATADDTITTLSEILRSTADTAAEIEASAELQAASMAQVRGAFENIDGVARGSVTSIQSVEASAQQLKTLSDQLRQLIAEVEA